MRNLDEIEQALKDAEATMNETDMLAVQYALVKISNEGFKLQNMKDEELENYVLYGCNTVNEGNAEPEYEHEDFYEKEADKEKVTNFIKLQREFMWVREMT